jgi:hypothetical protein
MSITYAELIDQFIDAINDTDAARRRGTIEKILTQDCAYTDPDAAVEGHDALDSAFARLQEQIAPGLRFSLAAPVDVHHEQARFFWQFGAPEATPVATGSDVAVFLDGRIHRIYAFFDTNNG